MKITLWQLNESYQALLRLAGQDFPKERHKLAYRLSRVVKTAQNEIEALGESLNDLMIKCGFEPGEQNIDPEKLRDYNRRAKQFMKETECDLWGDPMPLEDFAGVVSISPMDLALLDWLFAGGDQ